MSNSDRNVCPSSAPANELGPCQTANGGTAGTAGTAVSSGSPVSVGSPGAAGQLSMVARLHPGMRIRFVGPLPTLPVRRSEPGRGEVAALAQVDPAKLRALVNDFARANALSMTALAGQAGVGRSSLFAWLAGTATPTEAAFAALADLMDVDVVDLLERAGGGPVSALAAARLRRGWSRSRLAHRAGVSLSTVAAAEEGRRVRCDAAARIARTLGVDDMAQVNLVEEQPSRTELGRLLESERCRRGWTVAQVGQHFGVSRTMASSWLRGTAVVSPARWAALATWCRSRLDVVQQAGQRDLADARPAATAGQRLAKLRRDAGLTQAQLAQQVEVSRASVERWEMGLRAPGAVMRSVLAGQFGVPEDTFAA